MDWLTRPKLIKLDYPEGVWGGGAGITNFIFCFLRPSKFDTVGGAGVEGQIYLAHELEILFVTAILLFSPDHI